MNAADQVRATGTVTPPFRFRAPLAALNAALYLSRPRLVIAFRRHTGAWPNPALPQTAHDKYLWRKLFDRASWQTEVSDKLRAKDIAKSRLPGLRVPKTYWIGTDLADCPDEVLQTPVALKANHGCGFNRFLTGGPVDRRELARLANQWMAVDYSRRQGQWAYRNIQRRLFAEELLIDGDRLADSEFKVYVAGGRAVYTYVCYDRFAPDRGQSSDLFDPDGALLPGAIDVGTPRRFLPAPPQYPDIIAAALAVAGDVDLVRCDFYLHRQEVWFGEATVYSAGGYSWVEDRATMENLASSWDLTRSDFLRSPPRGWRGGYAKILRKLLSRPPSAQDARPVGVAQGTSGGS
ncbi:MAG: ATP-grasp fold amidoligase family protein [Bauldia sp.]